MGRKVTDRAEIRPTVVRVAQPPSGACSTTVVWASTVRVPPPGTSSAGVSSSGPV